MNPFQLNVSLVRVINFFNAVSKLFAPIQTVFFLSLGLDLVQVGLLTSIVWGSALLLELPGGILSDLMGRKLSLVISNLCLAIACLIYLTFSSFEWFAVATFVYGGHKAFRSGADSAITFESLKKLNRGGEFKKLWAHYFSENRLAYLVTGAAVGFIAVVSFKYVFAVALVSAIICVIAALLLTETINATKSKNTNAFAHLIEVSKYVWQNKPLFWTVTYFGLIAGFSETTFKFDQVYYQQIGLPLAFFGVFFMVTQVAGMLSARYTDEIERWFGEKQSIVILPVLICLAYIALWLHASALSLVIFIVIAALYSFRWNIAVHEINRFTKQNNRSSVFSVSHFANALAITVIAAILGYVAEIYGIRAVYLASGVALVVLVAYPTFFLHRLARN